MIQHSKIENNLLKAKAIIKKFHNLLLLSVVSDFITVLYNDGGHYVLLK
jgi:translation initiation factor RLI1